MRFRLSPPATVLRLSANTIVLSVGDGFISEPSKVPPGALCAGALSRAVESSSVDAAWWVRRAGEEGAREAARRLPAAAPCQMCGGRAELPHANCANIDCNKLFLACPACKVCVHALPRPAPFAHHSMSISAIF